MPSINTLIERMRYWCETASMGYSQYDRWNFNAAAGNCDCSSLVIHCLQEAGFDTGDATYTGNLSANLTARGWTRVANDGQPQAGDILLNDADHVAVYLGGGMLAQASISENNTIAGNAGDQTGWETNVSRYYDYPWNCYLRYTGESEEDMTIDELFQAKGNDGRNLWDSIIQTRSELRDRAGEGASNALITTKGNDGRNVLDSVIQARWDIAELKTMLTAQAATIETLAKAVGTNPTDIAKVVEQQVKAKLDKLQINVSATEKK